MALFNRVMHDPNTLLAIDQNHTYMHPEGIVFNEILYSGDLLAHHGKEEYDHWVHCLRLIPDVDARLRKAKLHIKLNNNDHWLRARYTDIAISYILLNNLPVNDIRQTAKTYADIGLCIRDLMIPYYKNYQKDLLQSE